MDETSTANALTAEQSAALFDILTHHETYKEIEDFKYPGAINHYGPPFQDDLNSSQAPLLQSLLAKFVLKLPGLRDVPKHFWRGRVQVLIEDLATAELSESYDKGLLGIRKTLATAASALIEYPARGALGGFNRQPVDKSRHYDVSNPEDVLQSWKDCMQDVVYGDLIDELFTKARETDDLKQHAPVVQAMHEFIVVNIASIMHYTLVLSPEGPSLLRMVDSIHKLLPYMLIRQTLKVGNVATMLSGLMRVVLAKASVASVTNWIGLSSGADEGMNLMQQIISQVLSWDKRELRKRAEKIEKDRDAPPADVREELRNWMQQTRAEHEECRRQSQESGMSIVAVILSLSSISTELSPEQHEKALEYLSLHLAIRDRDHIIRVLCQRNPDILTAAVRDAVDAYTPMIRHIHQAVNLSDTLWDFERFLTDALKIAKPTGSKGEEKPPTVEAFVDLLHRHQSSCHKFLHQFAKNGGEMTGWWMEYAHAAAAQFRSDDKPPPSEAVISERVSTGGIRKAIDSLFAELSEPEQRIVRQEADARSQYIRDLHRASAERISAVIKRTESTPFGPGAYLARWQQLLDDTRITPATAHGSVRYGSNKSVREETRKDIEGQSAGFVTEHDVREAEHAAPGKLPHPPRTDTTLRLFAARFREVLATG